MSDHNQKPSEQIALLCVGCGKPIAKGNYCHECVDRFGFCEGCEGRSLLDVETTE
jgi:predicted amidophosphoribosyltransferase